MSNPIVENAIFESKLIDLFSKIDDFNYDEENLILKDNNYVSIKGTPEYSTNLGTTTPTNRIITSSNIWFKIS